jgi:hypothetical protein
MENEKFYYLGPNSWYVQEGIHCKTALENTEDTLDIDLLPGMQVRAIDSKAVEIMSIDEGITEYFPLIVQTALGQKVKANKKINEDKIKDFIFIKMDTLEDVFEFAGGYACYHPIEKIKKIENLVIFNSGVVGGTPSAITAFLNEKPNKKYSFDEYVEIVFPPKYDYGMVFSTNIISFN